MKQINNPTGKGGFRDHPENVKPNKAGRPKKGETLTDLLEARLEQDFIDEKTGKNLGNTKKLLIEAWLRYALAGSFQHLKLMLDRLEGAILPEIDEINTNQLKVFLFQQFNLKSEFKFDKDGNLLTTGDDDGNGRFGEQSRDNSDSDSTKSG